MGSEGTQSSAIKSLNENRKLRKYESVFKRKNISTRDWLKLGSEIPQETRYAFPEMDETEWREFQAFLKSKRRKEDVRLTWLFIGIAATITVISITILTTKVDTRPDPYSLREKLKKERVLRLIEAARIQQKYHNEYEALEIYREIYSLDSTEPNARKALGLARLD